MIVFDHWHDKFIKNNMFSYKMLDVIKSRRKIVPILIRKWFDDDNNCSLYLWGLYLKSWSKVVKLDKITQWYVFLL